MNSRSSIKYICIRVMNKKCFYFLSTLMFVYELTFLCFMKKIKKISVNIAEKSENFRELSLIKI